MYCIPGENEAIAYHRVLRFLHGMALHASAQAARKHTTSPLFSSLQKRWQFVSFDRAYINGKRAVKTRRLSWTQNETILAITAITQYLVLSEYEHWAPWASTDKTRIRRRIQSPTLCHDTTLPNRRCVTIIRQKMLSQNVSVPSLSRVHVSRYVLYQHLHIRQAKYLPPLAGLSLCPYLPHMNASTFVPLPAIGRRAKLSGGAQTVGGANA